MRLEDLLAFANVLELENTAQELNGEGWLTASCPFAHWTHKSGTDRNPSFGMNGGDDNRPPGFHCFSCQQSGTLFDLVAALQFYHGQESGKIKHLKKASKFLLRYPEVFGGQEVEDRQHEKKRVKLDVFLEAFEKNKSYSLPVPDFILEKYPLIYPENPSIPQEVYEYLENERIIRPKVSEAYGLRYYKGGYGQDGIVFPVVSPETGKIVDLWVRLIETKKNFRLTSVLSGSPVDYHASHLWLGQQFFMQGWPTILVEGPFDLLRLRSLNIRANIYASLGPPSRKQLQQIYADTVYLGFDADEAGIKFTKAAFETLPVPRMFVLDWSLVGLKDAGDIKSPEQFEHIMGRRVLVQKPSAKLGKVESLEAFKRQMERGGRKKF